MTTRNVIPTSLHRLAAAQCGILTAEQIREHSISLRRRSQLIRDGLWTQLDYGLIYANAGRTPWRAYVWAAYLSGGDGAMVAGRTAARLFGLIDAEDLPAGSICTSDGMGSSLSWTAGRFTSVGNFGIGDGTIATRGRG